MGTSVIGFIGLGFIGTAYANNYEKRGYPVVRYEKGRSYQESKERFKKCNIVFVAVPTPTTPKGFNDGVVREVIKVAAPGTIVVIKSTVLPGTTRSIQKENPELIVLFSPEFLSEATAAEDAAHPSRNIIGLPIDDATHREAANRVMATFPEAPFSLICSSDEAELIKYGKNTLGYLRVLHTNLLYDIANSVGADFDAVRSALAADPELPGDRYLSPIHKTGRGAGGNCFIKDFEAFIEAYERVTDDRAGGVFLKAARAKNLALLKGSKKDETIVRGVYGKGFTEL